MERRDSGDDQLVIDEDVTDRSVSDNNIIEATETNATIATQISANNNETADANGNGAESPSAAAAKKKKPTPKKAKTTKAAVSKQPKPFKRLQTFKLSLLKANKTKTLSVSNKFVESQL